MRILFSISKSTLYSCLTILTIFFALGFAIFGPYTVGYSVGYVAAGLLTTFQAALPRLLLFAFLWVLFIRYINRK